MQNKKSKGFTFKVAEKAQKQTQVKAREGVAIAGCSVAAGSFPDFVLRNNAVIIDWSRPDPDWANGAPDAGEEC